MAACSCDYQPAQICCMCISFIPMSIDLLSYPLIYLTKESRGNYKGKKKRKNKNKKGLKQREKGKRQKEGTGKGKMMSQKV